MHKDVLIITCLLVFIIVLVPGICLAADSSSLVGIYILTSLICLLIYLLPLLLYRYYWYRKIKAPVPKIAAIIFTVIYGLVGTFGILLILDSIGESVVAGIVACVVGIIMTYWLLTADAQTTPQTDKTNSSDHTNKPDEGGEKREAPTPNAVNDIPDIKTQTAKSAARAQEDEINIPRVNAMDDAAAPKADIDDIPRVDTVPEWDTVDAADIKINTDIPDIKPLSSSRTSRVSGRQHLGKTDDALKRIKQLEASYRDGDLSKDEFEQQKKELLDGLYR